MDGIQIRDLQEILKLFQPDERVRIRLDCPPGGVDEEHNESESIPCQFRDTDGAIVLDFSP